MWTAGYFSFASLFLMLQPFMLHDLEELLLEE
jgi:hypothetical protein